MFSQLIIYRIEPSYRYVGHKLRHKKGFFSKLNLIVQNASRCFFDVWQNNPAYYKRHLGSHIDYEYARNKVWVCKEDDENGEWVEPGREVELTPGQYEVRVHLCQTK